MFFSIQDHEFSNLKRHFYQPFSNSHSLIELAHFNPSSKTHKTVIKFESNQCSLKKKKFMFRNINPC